MAAGFNEWNLRDVSHEPLQRSGGEPGGRGVSAIKHRGLQSLLENIEYREQNECWPWAGTRFKDGYGRAYISRTTATTAHRALWTALFGALSESIEVCHHCDNPPCCNPMHLFLGTARDNALDKVRKGRAPKFLGESNPAAKLSEQDVLAIRKSTAPNRALARQYGVSHGTVIFIRSRETWRHV